MPVCPKIVGGLFLRPFAPSTRFASSILKVLWIKYMIERLFEKWQPACIFSQLSNCIEHICNEIIATKPSVSLQFVGAF
jgi:hypothetical protein